MSSPKKLAQAGKLKEKQSKNVVFEDKSSFNSSTTVTNESFSSPPPIRTRSADIFYDKKKCIWCFKGPDKKHPNRKSPKLQLILLSEHGHLSNTIPFTAKNTVIPPNFLVWKFCGKAQFPHSFRRIARNYEKTVPFRKISTPGN